MHLCVDCSKDLYFNESESTDVDITSWKTEIVLDLAITKLAEHQFGCLFANTPSV